MKTALGLMWVLGLPYQLSLRKTKKPLPIAAVDFAEAVPSFCKIFNDKIRIYVMPDEFFVKIQGDFPANQAHAHGIS